MVPSPERLPVAELYRQLTGLGIHSGALLMVHASLRAVGPVEGGAVGVLEALRRAVGEAGTLVLVLGAEADEPFDAACSPAEEEMGVLAEVFRTQQSTRVNDHAAARFAAAGPQAPWLLEDLPLHDYHGPGSLVAKLTTAGGDVLRLGADPDTVTVTHWAEYLAEIPRKRRVRRRYLRADTGEQWIEGLDDNDGIADWDGGDYFPRIWLDYRAAGHPVMGPVGKCEAELFGAAHFVDYAKEWMEERLAGPRAREV